MSRLSSLLPAVHAELADIEAAHPTLQGLDRLRERWARLPRAERRRRGERLVVAAVHDAVAAGMLAVQIGMELVTMGKRDVNLEVYLGVEHPEDGPTIGRIHAHHGDHLGQRPIGLDKLGAFLRTGEVGEEMRAVDASVPGTLRRLQELRTLMGFGEQGGG